MEPSARPTLRPLLERRVEGAELSLPLLPAVPARVLSLASDEDGCEPAELAGLLQRDPALAGNVLCVANSSAWAPEEPIVSLQQAAARLGLRAVSEIAVAVALRSEVFAAPGHEERLRELWRHSAATGVWARAIARRLRRNVEGAFLCGLMHEVGKPVVLQTLVDLAGETGEPLEAELLEACMTELHEPAGARLAAEWGLPEWLVDAVGSHHRPEECPGRADLARVVRLADRIDHAVRAAGDDAPAADVAAAVRAELAEEPLLERLGVYPDDLIALVAERDEVRRMAEGLA